jgi:hypothetical protein
MAKVCVAAAADATLATAAAGADATAAHVAAAAEAALAATAAGTVGLGMGSFPTPLSQLATPSSWSPPVRWRPVSAAIPQRLCYCLLHPCYYHCHPSMSSLLGGVAIATLYLSPMISRFPRHMRQLPLLTYMLSGLVYKTFGHWFPSLGMKTFGNDR